MPAASPKRIAVLLNRDFADWEIGFLSATARDFFQAKVDYLTPDGAGVSSEGGMRVASDGTFAQAESDDFDALVVCGSARWSDPDAIDIGPSLRTADRRGAAIGVICAGTLTAARAGLFRHRMHTSNGAEWIAQRVPDYAGREHYLQSQRAILDSGVVSAPSNAPASFAAEVLGLLYADRPELQQIRSMLDGVR